LRTDDQKLLVEMTRGHQRQRVDERMPGAENKVGP
jgi:hypothetical protein